MDTTHIPPTPPHIDTPPGVLTLLAPNPSPMTGSGTNTFIVTDAPTGPATHAVVIDPGPHDESHLRAIVAASPPDAIQAILITHGHPDHVEGAARLRELTGAPILAHSHAGTPPADRALTDGALIMVGQRPLRALATPGHRFDHLCFLLEDAQALFAGDLVAGIGTVVIAPPEGDLLDYMASLRRLRAVDLRLLLPAHGPSIADPAALLDYYIHHRQERETQLLAALATAAAPPPLDALVSAIYTQLDPALRPMAALSLTAHLLKLEREGRVARLTPSASPSDATAHWRLIS